MTNVFSLLACVIIALFLLSSWWMLFAMCDCLLCVILVVVYLLLFFGGHDAVGILDPGVQQSYGVFCFKDEVGPIGFSGLLYAVLHA